VQCGCLCPVGDAEFGKDHADVHADRADLELELTGDGSVALSLGQQGEDVAFAGRQRQSRRHGTLPFTQRRQQLNGDDGLPAHHGPNGVHQCLSVDCPGVETRICLSTHDPAQHVINAAIDNRDESGA
jgi:hypothetical protein